MADTQGRTWVRVPVELSLPRLLGDTGHELETSPTTRRLVQLWDTGDRRLAAAGAELTFSARDGWRWSRDPSGHPKLASREWTAPPQTPEDTVALWARAYRSGRPLAPRATVQVHRRSHRLTDDDGAEVLAIDEEWIGEKTASGGWTARVRRVGYAAVAAGAAAQGLLDLLAEAAVPGGPILAILRPSLVRAPRLLVPADATAARALFVRSAVMSVMQWQYHDCELSGGSSPDAVRRLRVAIRRLRSDIQTFAPLLDRPWAEGLRARLGALAQQLGEVRDGEVLRARLAELLSLLPAAEQEAGYPLLDIAATQLAATQARLVHALSLREYTALLDEVVAAVTSPRWNDAEPGSVGAVARRPWRRLRDHVRNIGEDPGDPELHRARILAKRARYAAEACVPAVGKAAAHAAGRLADLQAVLGEHHDAAITRQWLQEQANANPALSFVAGELTSLELSRMSAARARWRGAWDSAARKEGWRWLKS